MAMPAPHRPDEITNKSERLLSKEQPVFPMDEYREQVMKCIRAGESAVIIGETGSGKTTRIPIFLMEEYPNAKIAITQPRRVAARSVSRFVAECRGEKVGQKIGFQVRFEDQTNTGTKANFMTDGILLKKIQNDPLLLEYDIIMVDEAHERSLNIDFLLGLLKRVQAARKKAGQKPLKVLATSATIEKEKFTRYFGDSPSVEVPGRMFPVDIKYVKDWKDEADCVVLTRYSEKIDLAKLAAKRVKEAVKMGEGDILIFMPGEDGINKTIEEIDKLHLTNTIVMPLYGAMSPEDQDRIFEKTPRRRIIVSTNIAETSVTIDGVRFVIDSGLIKQKEFDASTGIESLRETEHAKSGCEQRRGRAGRTAPGICFRLYTEDEYSCRQEHRVPEIARSNLDHVILAMKLMNIDDVAHFDFIDKPSNEAIEKALDTLKMLGALDEDENITELGRKMADLPLSPEIARMVLESEDHKCTGKICTIAAMLGGKSVFVRPREKEDEADNVHTKFKKNNSDFLTLLEVWEQWAANGYKDNWARENFLNVRQLYEIQEIRAQLMQELKNKKIPIDDSRGNDHEAIMKCITAGMTHHLMVQGGGHSYQRLKKSSYTPIFIHPSSTVFHLSPQIMIGSNVVTTTKTYARQCQMVKPEWIVEFAPQLLEEKHKSAYYNPEIDAVMEKVEYGLKGQYGVFIKADREVRDPAVASEQFCRYLATGTIDLPCVRHNAEILRQLRQLETRSGGKIEAPDLIQWYMEQGKGLLNKKQAILVDEQLHISLDRYCSPDRLERLNKESPESVIIRGSVVRINYEYRKGNPGAWSDTERNDYYTATFIIPNDLIFELNESDLPKLGGTGWPVLYFRTSESWGYTQASNLSDLRTEHFKKQLKIEWERFDRPGEYSLDLKEGELLPSIESTGLKPIQYATNFDGSPVMAYPGIKQETGYDGRQWKELYSYSVVYFQTEAEARDSTDKAIAIRNKEIGDSKIHEENKDSLPAVSARYEQANILLNRIWQNMFAMGFSSEEYVNLSKIIKEVAKNIFGSFPNAKQAAADLDVFEKLIAEKTKKKSPADLSYYRSRQEDLQLKVSGINFGNYIEWGLSYQTYNTIQVLWLRLNYLLSGRDLLGNFTGADPDVTTLEQTLNELENIIPLAKIRSTNRPISSLFRNEDDDLLTETAPTKANILEKALKGALENARKREPKSEVPKPEKSGPAKPKEREAMTEERKDKFKTQLDTADTFIDYVRSIPEPIHKAKNGEKISKTRAKAAEIRKDLKIYLDEFTKTEDVERTEGKVNELFKRADKVAREMAFLQGGREDWPDQFILLMDRLLEIAKDQSVELLPEQLAAVRKKVSDLARKPALEDIEAELETVILEVI